MNLTHFHP